MKNSIKLNRLDDTMYKVGLVLLVIGIIAIPTYLYILLPKVESTPCTMLAVFGIYCPGCGGTRALKAILNGNVLSALWYYPLLVYAIAVYVSFMFSQTIMRLTHGKIKAMRFSLWYLYGAIGILFANWIGKNILLYFFEISL